MEIQDKLDLYESMLKYYNDAIINGIAEYSDKPNGYWRTFGHVNHVISLCYVLNKCTPYDLHLHQLSELYSFKPKKGWKHNNNFWYRPDNIRIRVNMLEAVIDLIKQKIKEDEN